MPLKNFEVELNNSLYQAALKRAQDEGKPLAPTWANGAPFEGTTFMIAHRLSTLHEADRILVLDHGRLIEQGDGGG